MSNFTPKRASLDTIQRRLETREQDLNRRLDHALRSGGYDPATFFSPVDSTTLDDPQRHAVEAQIVAEIARGEETSWEELCRPELDDLNLDPRIQMLRI